MRVVGRGRRLNSACAWVAAVLLCAGGASAQDAPAAPDKPADTSGSQATPAQPEPASAEAPAQDAAPDEAAKTDDDAIQSPAQLSPTAAAQAADAKLNRELASVRYEQEHSGLLVPWVVTVTGAALMLTGLIFGVHAVLSCPHDSCKSPWWPGWVVVGGATVGIAGALWLRIEYREQAELASRRYQIERDLERSRINAAPLPSAANGPQAALQLRATF